MLPVCDESVDNMQMSRTELAQIFDAGEAKSFNYVPHKFAQVFLLNNARNCAIPVEIECVGP
jgi:hypothetical protein